MIKKQQQKKNILRQTRNSLGISQIGMAYLAGISRFNLWLCENGYRSLSPAENDKIQEVLAQLKSGGVANDSK